MAFFNKQVPAPAEELEQEEGEKGPEGLQLLDDPEFVEFLSYGETPIDIQNERDAERYAQQIEDWHATYNRFKETEEGVTGIVAEGLEEYGIELENDDDLKGEVERYLFELVHDDPSKYFDIASKAEEHAQINEEIASEQAEVEALLKKHGISLDKENMSDHPAENEIGKVFAGYDEKSEEKSKRPSMLRWNVLAGIYNKYRQAPGEEKAFQKEMQEAFSKLQSSIERKTEITGARNEMIGIMKDNKDLKEAITASLKNSLTVRMGNLDLSDIEGIQKIFEAVNTNKDVFGLGISIDDKRRFEEAMRQSVEGGLTNFIESGSWEGRNDLIEKFQNIFSLNKFASFDAKKFTTRFIDDYCDSLRAQMESAQTKKERAELNRKLILLNSIKQETVTKRKIVTSHKASIAGGPVARRRAA